MKTKQPKARRIVAQAMQPPELILRSIM